MTTLLVTAGPTREYLDDVRFLANGSSGRMGYAIAAAGVAAGHAVVLVSGPTDLAVPRGVERVSVTSAVEMLEAAVARFAVCDIAFGVAAVADYRPKRRLAGKPAKHATGFTLELVPNPDVIATLAAQKGDRVVVGFALESVGADFLAAARGKLERKQLDLIVVNPPPAVGAAESAVTVLFADGSSESLPMQPKERTAAALVARATALLEKKRRGAGG